MDWQPTCSEDELMKVVAPIRESRKRGFTSVDDSNNNPSNKTSQVSDQTDQNQTEGRQQRPVKRVRITTPEDELMKVGAPIRENRKRAFHNVEKNPNDPSKTGEADDETDQNQPEGQQQRPIKRLRMSRLRSPVDVAQQSSGDEEKKKKTGEKE
jgi:hypothetical protein